jgi:hypothetical protein
LLLWHPLQQLLVLVLLLVLWLLLMQLLVLVLVLLPLFLTPHPTSDTLWLVQQQRLLPLLLLLLLLLVVCSGAAAFVVFLAPHPTSDTLRLVQQQPAATTTAAATAVAFSVFWCRCFCCVPGTSPDQRHAEVHAAAPAATTTAAAATAAALIVLQCPCFWPHLTRDTFRLVRSSCAASARPMVGLGLTPGSCCRMALTWQQQRQQQQQV